MIVAYDYVHMNISPMLFYVDNTVTFKTVRLQKKRTVFWQICDALSYNT